MPAFSMAGRTKYVIMSYEASVLKHLREKAGLSMRQAGEAIGFSGSPVSQIENGRENPPKDERLTRFLDTCGVSLASFKRLVAKWVNEESELEKVWTLLSKLKSRDLSTVKALVEHLVKNKQVFHDG